MRRKEKVGLAGVEREEAKKEIPKGKRERKENALVVCLFVFFPLFFCCADVFCVCVLVLVVWLESVQRETRNRRERRKKDAHHRGRRRKVFHALCLGESGRRLRGVQSLQAKGDWPISAPFFQHQKPTAQKQETKHQTPKIKDTETTRRSSRDQIIDHEKMKNVMKKNEANQDRIKTQSEDEKKKRVF